VLSGSRSEDGIDGKLVKYEWDFDGDGVYDRATTASETRYAYASPGVRTVRLRDIRPRPPAGSPGVSIEGGRSATSSATVQLRLVWTPGATHALISNDGGFANAVRVPVTEFVPWTLDASGTGPLTKTVYVKFVQVDSNVGSGFQDDILLDRAAPATVLASTSGRATSVTLVSSGGNALLAGTRRLSIALRNGNDTAVVVSARLARGDRTLWRGGTTLPARGSRRLRITLSRTARVFLRHARTVRLSLTVRNADGTTRTVTKTLRVSRTR
jgi:hypothetical protein